MDYPETRVWLRSMRIACLRRSQPKSAARMEGLWLAGEESGFLEVDFECLKRNQPVALLIGCLKAGRIKTYETIP